MRHNPSTKILILSLVNEENELCGIIRNIGSTHTALPVCIHNFPVSFMWDTALFVAYGPRPAVWSKGENAQIDWRALSERSELGRPSLASVRPIS